MQKEGLREFCPDTVSLVEAQTSMGSGIRIVEQPRYHWLRPGLGD